MAELILEDAREYVLPLFTVEAKDNGIYLESRRFVATAFFVTKRGDALTTNHSLPTPADLGTRRLIAVVQQGDKQVPCWVSYAASFGACDLALIKVNLEDTKYLPVSDREILPGEDVQLIGVPHHEVSNRGKEMRLLKGHVTLSNERLELSVAVPAGMSGSPVFSGTTVIGYATGTVSSETLDEYSEEVELLSNAKEQIRITEVKRITHYGIAYPFYNLRSATSPILKDKTLFSFIEERNAKRI